MSTYIQINIYTYKIIYMIYLRWVTLSALSFLAHGDLLGFVQEHYGQHECPKDDANNDIVVRGAGVVFIHDILC